MSVDLKEFITSYDKHILIILIIISFFLSIYCWDCFNLYPGREMIVEASDPGNFFYNMRNLRSGQLILLRPLFQIFEPTLFFVRLVGSLINTGIILLIYLIAKKTFNTETAIIASILTTLAPATNLLIHTEHLHITFFSLLTVYLFIRFLEDPDILNGFLFGLINGLALFQKLKHAYIVFPLLLVTFLFYRNTILNKKVLKILPIILLAFSIGLSPYIINVYNSVEHSEDSQDNPVELVRHTLSTTFSNIEDHIELRSDQLITALAPGKETVNYVEEYNPYEEKKTARVTRNANFSIHGPANLISILLILFSFSILLLFGSKPEYALILFATIFFLLSFFAPNQMSMPIFHLTPILPFFYLIPARSYTISKKIDYGNLNKMVIVLILAFMISNIFSQFYYYNSINDEKWVNENWPLFSPVHTEARRKMNNLTDYGNRLKHPFRAELRRWTKGICSPNREPKCESFKQLECGDSLVLPYPPHKENSSELSEEYFNRRINPYKNIFNPYNSLTYEIEEENIKEQFIKDHENKRVYSIVELKC